ncbi:MAG: 2-amino-4-hydroxy-6-hydroxymethyldihydropteridine diphosphokinase [Prevotellaceae bacterium]|nr:2-amino-4-hydroxy-6-hydroxymethyldihydropteridine diphosphokinase [Candidatus Faecinaster equi]
MHQVLLSFGSNIADRESNIKKALEHLETEGIEVKKISGMYETEPWGFSSNNKFINVVALFNTDKTPEELLMTTEKVEKILGRTEKSIKGKYKDRIIDIDILAYDDELINTNKLIIPHPLMAERRFVIEPLCDILPAWTHPVIGLTAEEMLARIGY